MKQIPVALPSSVIDRRARNWREFNCFERDIATDIRSISSHMHRVAIAFILSPFSWTLAISQQSVFSTDFTAAQKLNYTQKGEVNPRDGEVVLNGGHLVFKTDRDGLIGKMKTSNELSVEVWFKAANLKHKGPARLFTFSKNTSERNFTIGQEGDHIEVRLRTTKTGNNGLPGIAAPKKSLKAERTHLVFTRQRNGEARLYLNGKEVAKQRIEGNFSNWNRDFNLIVGDENGGGRAWRGTVYSLCVVDSALNASEIKTLYDSGPGSLLSSAPPEKPELVKNSNEILFETQVTTILTKHCLECHDSASQKGDLDLSKNLKSHTEDGVIVVGKAADSLLWESVESDEMPKDRDPISDAEKKILKDWLNGGGSWTIDFVDPAIYSRPPDVSPTKAQRLTVTEYVRTIRDTFGVDVETQAREWLPADVRADGFSNTAYNLTIDLEHIEGFSNLAGFVAGKIDPASFAKRFTNKRDLTDKTMIALIDAMGRVVLRGPLSGEETALYRGVSTSVASAGGDFDEAIRFVVEAMLQSPRFIYRLEETPEQGRQLLDDYEMASRLSYVIWGSSPDRKLLELADNGDLNHSGQIKAQAARMLNDPKAIERSLDFASDWLHLDRLSHLQPGKEHFPDWDPALASEMRSETLAFFREVVWKEKLPLSSLLNAPFTFVSPALADHYGIPAPVAGKEGLQRVDLSKVVTRGGILTQGSVLTIGGDEASMVTRGLFVLNDLLRGVIKDPPPCVSTVPVPSEPGKTQRMIAMERVASKSCGACHVRFEPLAYGLERFDGLGAFHEKDHFGNPLRDDGEVLFPGTAEPVAYKQVGELMDLLARSDRVKETLTWKLVQFAVGRPLSAADAESVFSIHHASQEAGGRYEDVISAIVQSDLLRYAFAGNSNPSH
ncbi:DUF1592 domain-containing protein [Verrucomicrobiales bacterium]|nr:DUF1592 domain-containing protein [Verrucomicrobiales bacterium]